MDPNYQILFAITFELLDDELDALASGNEHVSELSAAVAAKSESYLASLFVSRLFFSALLFPFITSSHVGGLTPPLSVRPPSWFPLLSNLLSSSLSSASAALEMTSF